MNVNGNQFMNEPIVVNVLRLRLLMDRWVNEYQLNACQAVPFTCALK